MTAREYFTDKGELTDMQTLFIDLCLCAIAVLAIVVAVEVAV
jgi:hypothetical protein